MDVKTREGRAIKVEGNPLSPISHGNLCARGQASLEGLYNPDRVPQALARNAANGWDKLTWDDAEQRLATALDGARGRTVFLTRNYTGTMGRLVSDWSDALGVEHVVYEPFAWEPVRAANRLLFGVDAVPVHDFAHASVVIGFGADFLETWVSPIDYAHGFVQGTAYKNGERGTFYAFTPHQTLTDMNADVWSPIVPGTEHLVALAIAKLVAQNGGNAGAAAGVLAGIDVDAVAKQAGVKAELLRQAATDFANGGHSLAVGPGPAATNRTATATAAAVAILNAVAGNYGKTLSFAAREEFATGTASYADLRALVARMKRGEVAALLVDGPNPLYTMPEKDDVAGALAKVPFIASFSPYLDETSARAHLLLPDHHFLESWGDYVPRTGLYSIVQPTMMPVFQTKQTGDVLLSVAAREKLSLGTDAHTFYDYLREAWARDILPKAGGTGPFETWWEEVLRKGVVETAETAGPAAPALSGAGLGQIDFGAAEFTAAKTNAGGDAAEFYLLPYPSYRYYDGRLANRPWLQELPDPVSKLTWTSWLEMNPVTAARMGVDDGNVVEIETANGKATLPVWRHPGMRLDAVAIQVGQGHDELGRWASDRGVNALDFLAPVVEKPSGSLVWAQTKATVRATGEWVRMPTQTHVKTEAGREITEAMSLADARRATGTATRPGAGAVDNDTTMVGGKPGVKHEADPTREQVWELQQWGGFGPDTVLGAPAGFPPPDTYYGAYAETQPRWGMAIDMERCIGCSACVTACYAENNIGVVGPDQVAMGRILHWIRIERYFEGPIDKPEHVSFLPMLCQQCGNAPCEPVCPVFASYHTPEGLNAQVYNRCVGTRYCANNCPYKVRYFNWFSWEWPEPLNWQLNPDVTVREKGVMEKCTFCVQRIRQAQHDARLEDRGVHDGEIVPACAQTCPGDAIVFGNVKDPNSRVAQIAASGRGYRVLDELNTQSAIVYLKKVLTAGASEA